MTVVGDYRWVDLLVVYGTTSPYIKCSGVLPLVGGLAGHNTGAHLPCAVVLLGPVPLPSVQEDEYVSIE